MTFRSTLLDGDRGRTWSFALTVTGVPDLYTDGLASWASFGGRWTQRIGCLYTRDFNIDLRADPLKPLTTGGELAFQIGDDGTGEVYLTYAPAYTGAKDYLAEDLSGSATLVEFGDGTNLPADTYGFLGLETVSISDISAAPDVSIGRADFGTIARAFRTQGLQGVEITSSPINFSGRFVSLYAAPVNSATGDVDLIQMGKIWAGTVKLVRQQGARIELQCGPLGAVLETDWPARMPAGQIKSGGNLRFVSEGHWSQGLRMEYSRNRPDAAFVNDTGVVVSPIYEWDPTGASYGIVDGSEGLFPLESLARYIQDTINYVATNNTDYPFLDGVNRTLVNAVTLSTSDNDQYYEIWLHNRHSRFEATVEVFGLTFDIRPGRHRIFRVTKEAGIGKADTQIPVFLDHPSYLFELSYKGTLGAARISDGTDYEVITFTGVDQDADEPRRITLTGVTRGFDGRPPKSWGVKEEEDGEPKGAEIVQLLFAHEDAGIPPEDLICALLLSTETLYLQGSTDFWTGYRQCLGIPIEFVDVEGITRALRKVTLERINSFWVDEPGKGKKSLEEFMKFYGAFFVTKQFTRGGTTYFGLSVDTVDTPTRTFYQDELTDADRQSGTEPLVDHNERLVINQISFKPFDRVYAKNGDEAPPIYIYDEFSIARHGPQKALEMSPTVFDRYGTSLPSESGSVRHAGRDAQAAIALGNAIRWFAAYGRGNYKLSMTMPAPVGWRIYPGVHVLVDLTGVRSPQGSPNLSQTPARVYNVMQRWGQRGGCDFDARLSFDAHCELAPSARVLSATSSTITLDANYFTLAGVRGSFEDVESATDADWFDPTRYGGDIPCEIWSEGRYDSTVQTFAITARNGNVLSVNTNLTATAPITNLPGVRAIIGFQGYDSGGTAFQTSFAHIADNGTPPTLGAAEDEPKVYG